MCKFLFVVDVFMEMMIFYFLFFVIVQKYCMEIFYEGFQDDEFVIVICDCDFKGLFMFYVFKMVLIFDKGCFYVFGCVFLGIVCFGFKVCIQGFNYIFGKKEDFFIKVIQCIVLMMGGKVEFIDDMFVGNIVGLVGIDQFLFKFGIFIISEIVYNFKVMKFFVFFVVQCFVVVKNVQDFFKFVEGFKCFFKFDFCVLIMIFDFGEYIVVGVGEFYFEICLKDFEEDYVGVLFNIFDFVVQYCEIVIEKFSMIVFFKFFNKYNCLYMVVEFIDEEFFFCY